MLPLCIYHSEPTVREEEITSELDESVGMEKSISASAHDGV